MSGVVIYRGPSKLDGEPIAAGVTFDSHNSKTGGMAQAWIVRADLDAMDAIRTGADSSICGACPHRSGSEVGRSCYVPPWRGPIAVSKKIRNGGYLETTPEEGARMLAGDHVRIAAYGDPAAVPFDVWRRLLRYVAGWTGYTHQWRTCDPRFASICMASVESEAEILQARAIGYRTFRARLSNEPVRGDEIVCPASEEGGRVTNCENCGLCSGGARAGARSIAIIGHGHFVLAFQRLKEQATRT